MSNVIKKTEEAAVAAGYRREKKACGRQKSAG